MEESKTLEVKGQAGYQYSDWSGYYFCSPELYFEPRNQDELRQILCQARREGKRVKAIGYGTSCSNLPCTEDYMICMKHFNKLLQVDQDTCLIKVEAGAMIKELNEQLWEHNLAFSSTPVIDEISIGGAISTASHGTGLNYSTMAHHVQELELMLADGSLLKLTRERDGDRFRAAVVSMGTLGVLLTITYQCEPAFRLEQKTCPAKLSHVLENIEQISTSADHVMLSWFPNTDFVTIMQMSRTEKEFIPPKQPSWSRGIILALFMCLHDLLYWICLCFPKLTPYVHRLYAWLLFSEPQTIVDRGYRMFILPGLSKHLAGEWAIPREKAAEAVMEMKTWLKASHFPADFPFVVRFCKADDLYLSPAYGRESCYINITNFKIFGKYAPHEDYWTAFARVMKSMGGRPHWSKHADITASELQALYPGWEIYSDLRKELDPDGMFLNDFNKSYLLSSTG